MSTGPADCSQDAEPQDNWQEGISHDKHIQLSLVTEKSCNQANKLFCEFLVSPVAVCLHVGEVELLELTGVGPAPGQLVEEALHAAVEPFTHVK